MASKQTTVTAIGISSMRLENIFGKVICSNSDNIAAIARDPMRLLKTSLRDMVSCDKLPDVNLEVWKDSFKCKQE